jgi:hypothetical protein
MAKRFSTIYGAMFVVFGLLGFVPNPLVGDNGFFMTNGAHDFAHLLIGAVLLWAGTQAERTSYLSLMTFGAVYGLLALMGYATAGAEGHANLLGIVHVNGNDNWLHVLLAVLLIATALASRRVIPRPATQH